MHSLINRIFMALMVALSFTIGGSAQSQAQSWDMPTPYGDSTFHTQNIIQFAEDVRAATQGALDITVHSAGSLIPHSEIKAAVRSRQVPLGEFLLSRLSNEDAAYGIDSQPFLATTYAEAQALWQAQEPVITGLLAQQGLRPLFSVPWPAQGLYTNGEITSVADLRGLRFRAYNAALEEFATLAGAAPVQVEAADIPQAFATGQVQAMVTSPSTGVNTSAWDFVTHYSPINAWIPKNIVVVNARLFDRLDADIQAAVLAAAAQAQARGWALSAAEAASKTAALAENGLIVYEPSATLVSDLQGIGAHMLSNWKAGASADALAIIQQYGP